MICHNQLTFGLDLKIKADTYEAKRHDLGYQFFFPQKLDLINLFLKLGHSLLFNVFCA